MKIKADVKRMADREEETGDPPARHGKPWMTHESVALHSAMTEGQSLVATARALERKLSAVLLKLANLGYMVKGPAPGYSLEFGSRAMELARKWHPDAPIREELVQIPDSVSTQLEPPRVQVGVLRGPDDMPAFIRSAKFLTATEHLFKDRPEWLKDRVVKFLAEAAEVLSGEARLTAHVQGETILLRAAKLGEVRREARRVELVPGYVYLRNLDTGEITAIDADTGNEFYVSVELCETTTEAEGLKELEMKTINVEEITFLNNVKASEYTDMQLLTMMQELEAQKVNLTSMDQNDLTKKYLDKTNADIEVLRAYMNKRASAK